MFSGAGSEIPLCSRYIFCSDRFLSLAIRKTTQLSHRRYKASASIKPPPRAPKPKDKPREPRIPRGQLSVLPPEFKHYAAVVDVFPHAVRKPLHLSILSFIRGVLPIDIRSEEKAQLMVLYGATGTGATWALEKALKEALSDASSMVANISLPIVSLRARSNSLKAFAESFFHHIVCETLTAFEKAGVADTTVIIRTVGNVLHQQRHILPFGLYKSHTDGVDREEFCDAFSALVERDEGASLNVKLHSGIERGMSDAIDVGTRTEPVVTALIEASLEVWRLTHTFLRANNPPLTPCIVLRDAHHLLRHPDLVVQQKDAGECLGEHFCCLSMIVQSAMRKGIRSICETSDGLTALLASTIPHVHADPSTQPSQLCSSRTAAAQSSSSPAPIPPSSSLVHSSWMGERTIVQFVEEMPRDLVASLLLGRVFDLEEEVDAVYSQLGGNVKQLKLMFNRLAAAQEVAEEECSTRFVRQSILSDRDELGLLTLTPEERLQRDLEIHRQDWLKSTLYSDALGETLRDFWWKLEKLMAHTDVVKKHILNIFRTELEAKSAIYEMLRYIGRQKTILLKPRGRRRSAAKIDELQRGYASYEGESDRWSTNSLTVPAILDLRHPLLQGMLDVNLLTWRISPLSSPHYHEDQGVEMLHVCDTLTTHLLQDCQKTYYDSLSMKDRLMYHKHMVIAKKALEESVQNQIWPPEPHRERER